MNGIRLFAIAATAMAASASVAAQSGPPPGAAPPRPDFSKIEEKSRNLGHGLYMITGAGGNTTLAVGSDGLIVVDTQFAPVYPKLKAAIAAISTLPVKYVIDTHYHGDHTGGNANFAQDGATIVAQANVVRRLREPPPGPNGQAGQPAPEQALPTRTYEERLTLSLRGRTAELTHLHNAHTDGDTVVYFPGANVVSTGDIVGSESYPNIDIVAGGSIDGLIKAVDVILKMTNDQTEVVPGHGHLTNRAGVRQYRAMLVKARELISKEIAAGKSEDQVFADKPLAELDARWAAPGNPFAARFPRLVYRSLKQEQQAR